ncbi:hypothetical protein N7520_007676 [Penicillium odoratum]|uniref:uncharacterized protein n=1 Tax=Penicillium odoratum TaxID=1167516 RepID=UPI002546AAC4|nr:uncharacterized protein N7520_007676 [Penicillium odoratum]KAJ5760520.1 hypothetical protein N7520_007676 [Penicillium odoratum]
MTSQKRITKELAELTESPPDGISVELADEANLYEWKVASGTERDPPKAGTWPPIGRAVFFFFNIIIRSSLTFLITQKGRFLVKLSLPTGYPFKPPTVSFATRIYHPNITNDEKGSMCLGMLRADEWKPSSKISAVLQFARQLLSEPMPDDAIEGRIADQYKNDKKRYEEIARDWTRKYAVAE